MAVEDYRQNHWPNLEKAIDRLLIQSPTDHISVSYAQIYRQGDTGMLTTQNFKLIQYEILPSKGELALCVLGGLN